jgi:hypothetical protein
VNDDDRHVDGVAALTAVKLLILLSMPAWPAVMFVLILGLANKP